MNIFNKILLWFILPSKRKIKKITDNVIKNIKIIETNSEGFTVTTTDTEKKNYHWKDILNIRINDSKTEIISDKKIIEVLTPDYTNYYDFIQKIPKDYKDFDYSFVDLFFTKLSGCKCCGLISLFDNKCLACGFEKWNNGLLDEYNSEEEYNRERQYELFEPFNDDEIDINNKPEQGFKSDTLWIPIVKKEDFVNSY